MFIEITNDNIPAGHEVSTHNVTQYYVENFNRKRKFKKRIRETPSNIMRELTPIDESETSLCTSLWRSVIVQALYDVAGKGGNETRKLVRAESNSWFANIKMASNDNGPTDFEYVCELANLNPATVLKIVKEVREKGNEILESYNSRTFRKKYSSREGRRVSK